MTKYKNFLNPPDFLSLVYMISIDEPHLVIEKTTHHILDEWYNGYGEISVLLNNKLYLIDELLELVN